MPKYSVSALRAQKNYALNHPDKVIAKRKRCYEKSMENPEFHEKEKKRALEYYYRKKEMRELLNILLN
jgi:hypothetical protein